MKKLFTLALALAMICTAALADYDGEILFRDIPWMCSIDEANEQLLKSNIDVLKGLGGVYETDYLSSWGPDRFKHVIKDADAGFWCYYYLNDDFMIAGHVADTIIIYALYDVSNGKINTERKASKYYMAEYQFDKGDNDKEVFNDLRDKLTVLYGKPTKIVYGDYYWYGKNNTGVALIDAVYDYEICYGRTDADDMIDELVAALARTDTTGAYDGL